MVIFFVCVAKRLKQPHNLNMFAVHRLRKSCTMMEIVRHKLANFLYLISL